MLGELKNTTMKKSLMIPAMGNLFLFGIMIVLMLFSFASFDHVTAQIVTDFKVNDDNTTYNKFNAAVDVDEKGNFIVVWDDRRRSIGTTSYINVYAQKFNTNGIPIGENFIVNENLDSAGFPSITVTANGNFAIVWRELNGVIPNLYFRLFGSNCIPFTPPIIINDTLTGDFSPVKIGVGSDGIFVVTWKDRIGLSTTYSIKYQRFDSFGNKLGQNFWVNNYTNTTKDSPAITVRREGSFIITWHEYRIQNHNPYVFMQMFDPEGNPIDSNRQVSEFTEPIDYHDIPNISSDSAGNFIITWSDSRGGIFPWNRKYAQAYNKNGEKIGNNFRLLEILESAGNVTVKLKDGRFLFGTNYEQSFGTLRGVFQRYDSSYTKIGGTYNLSTQSPGSRQAYTDAKVFEDRIINVWTDHRNGNADIYCNIYSFNNPDSVVNINPISQTIPESFKLHQNFPNPFNPLTMIRFDIPDYGVVKLSVHDALGREVATLVNENLQAGAYQYQFATNNYYLGSGIYLFKLEFSDLMSKNIYLLETKKAVLIK